MAGIDIGKAITESFSVLRSNPAVLVPIGIAATLTTLFYDYILRVEAGFEFFLYVFLPSLVMAFLICLVIRMVYDATRGEASLSRGATTAGRKCPVSWWQAFWLD